jgi:hypothetical protein
MKYATLAALMKHVETIEILIQTLVQSETFHALVVESPPGWSKSTTIDAALKRLSMPFIAMGSYTTALHFYNTLAEHSRSMVVLDDCAGLFNDPKTMALLKGATWPASGESGPLSSRRISWGSTSEKVSTPRVDFSGKIILLTNTLPAGREIQAFLSRCLNFRITFTENQIKKMILEAALSTKHFADTGVARLVAQFIVSQGDRVDYSQVNLRTLRLGYELASTQSRGWMEVLPHLLPTKVVSKVEEMMATALINPSLPSRLQESEFRTQTGKSRRTFYNYKKKLGLTRPYRSKATV